MHVTVHSKLLSTIYREHRIRFLSTKYHFHVAGDKVLHRRAQYIWVKQHAKYLQQKRECVYVDESSCNLWVQKQRVWRPKDMALNQYLQKKRGSNVMLP